VLLDEGVPADVATVFAENGHEALLLKDVLQSGSADVLVCKAAIANDAVLVACDRDMKQWLVAMASALSDSSG